MKLLAIEIGEEMMKIVESDRDERTVSIANELNIA